jgi:opacity protein-like surface antigen
LDDRGGILSSGTPSRVQAALMLGWDVGAGVEVIFGSGWTWRVEYRHYEFGAVHMQPDGEMRKLRR